MIPWYDLLNPHLKDRIKILTDEDWIDIERVGSVMSVQHALPLIVAEGNALLALLNAKENGTFTRLVN